MLLEANVLVLLVLLILLVLLVELLFFNTFTLKPLLISLHSVSIGSRTVMVEGARG